MRWLRKQICSLKRVGACSCVNKGQRDSNKGAAQSKPESRAESLKLNVAFAEKGI